MLKFETVESNLKKASTSSENLHGAYLAADRNTGD